MQAKIAVVGSSHLEIKGSSKEELNLKERNFGKIEVSFGGSGKKIAKELGNLNFSPSFISTIDNTTIGSDLKKELTEAGVDTNYLLPINIGGMGKTMSFVDQEGEVLLRLTEEIDISHLEKYIEKYGEKFAKEFDILLIDLDLSEKIAKKIINSFKLNKKKIFIHSRDMLDNYPDYTIFEEAECLFLDEKSAGVLLDIDLCAMEIHQIQKTFKEFIQTNSTKRGIIELNKRGAVFYDNILNQSSFIEASKEELLFPTVIKKLLNGLDLKDLVTYL